MRGTPISDAASWNESFGWGLPLRGPHLPSDALARQVIASAASESKQNTASPSASVASRASDQSLLTLFHRRLVNEVFDVLTQAAHPTDTTDSRSVPSPHLPSPPCTVNYGDPQFTAAAAHTSALLEGLGYNLSSLVEPDVLTKLRRWVRGRASTGTAQSCASATEYDISPVRSPMATGGPGAPSTGVPTPALTPAHATTPAVHVYYYEMLANYFQCVPVWGVRAVYRCFHASEAVAVSCACTGKRVMTAAC